MKVTIVHTNNKKQLLVSTKTMEKLLQRIAADTNITRICQHGCTSIPLLNSPKTKTTT